MSHRHSSPDQVTFSLSIDDEPRVHLLLTEDDLARKPLNNIGELILIVIPEDLISLSFFRSCDTLTVESG